eukprot:4978193-Heterocapsa_arctica.AAC.1
MEWSWRIMAASTTCSMAEQCATWSEVNEWPLSPAKWTKLQSEEGCQHQCPYIIADLQFSASKQILKMEFKRSSRSRTSSVCIR